MNKEYKLVQSRNIDEIESQINELANQGWELNGSITPAVLNGQVFYTQTMVREKKGFNEGNSDNGKQLLHG
jgi:hypothetical protein